jgi:DNA-binding transcriptional MerR regulator
MTEDAGTAFPWEDDEAAGAPTDEAATSGPANAGPEGAGDTVATRQPTPDQDPVVERPADGAPRAAAPPPRAAAAPSAPGRRQEPPRPLVQKEYYSISEVADLVGLPAHVLRYWESQFSVLNPSKNRSGNRVYQRKEIRLILLVKQLLHDEKYTVEGARQKLDQLRRGAKLADATTRALDAQLVHTLRDELQALSELLRPDAD